MGKSACVCLYAQFFRGMWQPKVIKVKQKLYVFCRVLSTDCTHFLVVYALSVSSLASETSNFLTYLSSDLDDVYEQLKHQIVCLNLTLAPSCLTPIQDGDYFPNRLLLIKK